LQYGEAYGVSSHNPYQGNLTHTYNFYETYSTIPIDSQFVFGQIWGIFPDVYRGGKAGEVYVSSMFPEGNNRASYKVSFSADTGHTFRHVYVSKAYHPDEIKPIFMSDREPGVFYIVHQYEIEDSNPWGRHTRVCIEYYRDYGETLVDTYCHELTKDYGKVFCKPVNDLAFEKPNPHTILLTWSKPETALQVEGYNIFRNNLPLNNALWTTTTY